MRQITLIAAALFSLVPFASAAHADILQWEYTNAADPSQGKQQSTALAPDGAGVDAVPEAELSNRDLTMAYLMGEDLTGAYGPGAILTNADLSQSNLANAYLNPVVIITGVLCIFAPRRALISQTCRSANRAEIKV
jgi:uncharacterized protein YjbI with pentapeptide repeats